MSVGLVLLFLVVILLGRGELSAQPPGLEAKIKALEKRIAELEKGTSLPKNLLREGDLIALQGRAGAYVGVNDGGFVDDPAKRANVAISGETTTGEPSFLLKSMDGIVTTRKRGGHDEAFRLHRYKGPWQERECGTPCNTDPGAAAD